VEPELFTGEIAVCAETGKILVPKTNRLSSALGMNKRRQCPVRCVWPRAVSDLSDYA
jgi:hypothetical protein